MLDKSRIPEPNIHDEHGNVNNNAAWDGDNYVPVIDCPACDTVIRYTDGDTA